MKGRQHPPLLLLRMDDHSMWNTLLGLGGRASEPSSALGFAVAGCSLPPPSQGQSKTGQWLPRSIPGESQAGSVGKSHVQKLERQERWL